MIRICYCVYTILFITENISIHTVAYKSNRILLNINNLLFWFYQYTCTTKSVHEDNAPVSHKEDYYRYRIEVNSETYISGNTSNDNISILAIIVSSNKHIDCTTPDDLFDSSRKILVVVKIIH